MVLIAGETHVIHDAVLDAGIHELVAANGAVPLPVDCFPMPAEMPELSRVHWASAGQTLRATAAGAAAGDVFPLLLGAYGCGPNSMVEHLFTDLVEDWPHAVLESDGHGGKAGYVTRVQAFLHSVRAGARRLRRQRVERVTPPGRARPAPGSRRASRASTGACHTASTRATTASSSATSAAASAGISPRRCAAPATTPTFVGEPDAAALRAAGAACSGKECLPYQLIWGTLRALPRRGGAATSTASGRSSSAPATASRRAGPTSSR